MLVSLSKINSDIATAFTKVALLVAYSDSPEYKFPRNLAGDIREWVKQGREFMAHYKFDLSSYDEMTDLFLKGYTLHSEDEDFLGSAYEVAKQVRDKSVRAKIENETLISRSGLDIIKKFYTVATSPKETSRQNAINVLKTKVSDLNDVALSSLFELEVSDQDSLLKKVSKLSTKLGGDGTIHLSQELRKKHKDNPVYVEFRKASLEVNKAWKNFVVNYVRQSGKPYLDIREVIDAVKDAGIRHHNLPEQFVGYIDDTLSYYTSNGLLLSNKGIAGDVRMNPNYDPKKDNAYVLEYKAPAAENYLKVYTERWNSKQRNKKFKIVEEFEKVAPGVRRRWLQKLKSEGISTKEGLLCLVIEVMYQTSARIGTREGKTGDKTTYGLTVLQSGHYYKKGQNREIKYEAKKAQVQKHLLKPNSVTNKLVIELLDQLSDGKKRKDPLFTFGNRRITANAVNKYLKSMLPEGVTAHKFRTLKGTRLARDIIEKCPLFTRKRQVTNKDAETWLKGALQKVAKELGHFNNGKLTISTAIANYIDPAILADFYERLGLRMPANIEKLI